MPNPGLPKEVLQHMVDVLAAHDGNKAEAARALDMAYPTFFSRIQIAERLELEPSEGIDGALPSPMGESVRSHSGSRIYVITAAQNATPLHPGIRSLRRYCRVNDATLLAVPFRYRNPTSLWSQNQEHGEWWHKDIAEHLIAENVELNDNLMLAGRIKTQPTARNPLTSMETYSGGRSAIFGHAKRQLVSVATPQNRLPKLLATTGCITVENYTDSTRGALGEHHHCLGALVVEIVDDKRFHMRQITICEDGSFIDLDREYTPRTVRKAPRPEALTCADIHWQQMDPVHEAATFGPGGIVEALRPRRLVFHDLLDFYSANHHHQGDFAENWRKRRLGLDNVYREVRGTLDWLDAQAAKAEEIAVVESNHNEAFWRWLNEGRGDRDPENAWFYYNTWAGILPPPGHDDDPIGHPLEYWYGQWHGRDNVRFLRRSDSYLVGEIEHGMHGDVGLNGARGSVRSFNRIGVRSSIGHAHGPGIHEGVHQVGVMGLYQRYNERGPSNWLPTHSLQYANGKRTLITLVDGAWRLGALEKAA